MWGNRKNRTTQSSAGRLFLWRLMFHRETVIFETLACKHNSKCHLSTLSVCWRKVTFCAEMIPTYLERGLVSDRVSHPGGEKPISAALGAIRIPRRTDVVSAVISSQHAGHRGVHHHVVSQMVAAGDLPGPARRGARRLRPAHHAPARRALRAARRRTRRRRARRAARVLPRQEEETKEGQEQGESVGSVSACRFCSAAVSTPDATSREDQRKLLLTWHEVFIRRRHSLRCVEPDLYETYSFSRTRANLDLHDTFSLETS